jgi:hypothetical protein
MATPVPTTVDYDQLSNLRQVLAPQYAILPAYRIRAQMEALYGPEAADVYEDYLEDLFGSIGKAFSSAARTVGGAVSKAAPAVATVGGGALQGALSGAQFGLPGIIAGAAVGGAGAGLSKYGKGTARQIGGALSGVTGLAGQFSGLGRVGGAIGPAISGLAGGGRGGAAGGAVNALSGILGGVAGGAGGPAGALGGLLGGRGGAAGALSSLLGGRGGAAGALGALLGGGPSGPAGALTSLFGGSGATGQLLSLLQRPETMQALAALNLGPMGRSTVPVGSEQVPTAGIATLMSHLASQASAEATEWWAGPESEMHYMMDEAGEFVGDPALDRDRAARIWALLNEAQAERLLGALETMEIEQESAEAEFDEAAFYAEREAEDEAYYDAMDLAETDALSADAAGEAYPAYAEAETEYAEGVSP